MLGATLTVLTHCVEDLIALKLRTYQLAFHRMTCSIASHLIGNERLELRTLLLLELRIEMRHEELRESGRQGLSEMATQHEA